MNPKVILTALLASTLLFACGDGGDGDGGGADETGGSKRSRPTGPFFTEEAEARGIVFTHSTGKSGKRFTVETVTGGAALFDMDDDGDLDALLLNGGPLPGNTDPKPNALFENDGTGHFKEVPDAGGLSANQNYAIGCAVADIDLDGDLDVLITNLGQDRLYRNDGGARFTDITAESGIDTRRFGSAAAFGDLNGDKLPDLYIANYVDWTVKTHKACYNGEIHAYCGPNFYKGQRDAVFINQGNGKFKNRTRRLLHSDDKGKGLGVVMADIDGDGDLDVYVANDQTSNFLHINDGKGRLVDNGLVTDVALGQDAEAEAGMGAMIADIDNDGHEDILVTNFADQPNSIYRNTGDGYFEHRSFELGIGFETRPMLGWGLGAVDFDHDGWKDIFSGNSHVYDNTAEIKKGTSFPQKNLLHMNDGTGKFKSAAGFGGPALQKKDITRGVAFGDIDNDGDVDILCCNIDSSPDLLINNGANGGFLMVDPRDAEAGSVVLGTRVDIDTGESRQTSRCLGSYSFLCFNDTRVHFGIGDADVVKTVKITWPGGKVHVYENVPADRLLRVSTNGTAEIRKLGDSRVETKLKAG